jgi:hypothetical protein
MSRHCKQQEARVNYVHVVSSKKRSKLQQLTRSQLKEPAPVSRATAGPRHCTKAISDTMLPFVDVSVQAAAVWDTDQ